MMSARKSGGGRNGMRGGISLPGRVGIGNSGYIPGEKSYQRHQADKRGDVQWEAMEQMPLRVGKMVVRIAYLWEGGGDGKEDSPPEDPRSSGGNRSNSKRCGGGGNGPQGDVRKNQHTRG